MFARDFTGPRAVDGFTTRFISVMVGRCGGLGCSHDSVGEEQGR